MFFFYDYMVYYRETLWTTDNNIVRNKLINNGKKKIARYYDGRFHVHQQSRSPSKLCKGFEEFRAKLKQICVSPLEKPISNVTVFRILKFSVSRYWKKWRKINFSSIVNLSRENIRSSELLCNVQHRTVKFLDNDFNFFTFKTTIRKLW